MEAPKVIWARPAGAGKDWSDYTSGPWSMKNPYGTSARYIRADAPELVALVGFVQWLNSCIDANITENETGENRLLLNDGSVYTGPAVDWMHKVLTGIRDISDKSLAAWGSLSGMDLELEECDMAYSRWSDDDNSLYIWSSFDALHVWKPGQGDKEGLVFKDGEKTEYAEALFRALNDYLVSNGMETKIRAGKLTIRKARK